MAESSLTDSRLRAYWADVRDDFLFFMGTIVHFSKRGFLADDKVVACVTIVIVALNFIKN